GLSAEVIDRHFTGTPSPIGGLTLDAIAREVLERHVQAFGPKVELDEGSEHRFRRHGETHAFAPPVIKALHGALRSGERLDYARYAELVHARDAVCLRDLLEFRTAEAVALDEVEPASGLV